jgi:predicted CXXCH cytochrome family protein
MLALMAVGVVLLHGCGGGDKGPAPPVVPSTDQGPFVGAAACKVCHSSEMAGYMTTKHAQAFSVLQAAHSDKNPNCIGCHVVGFKVATGFVSLEATPQLANVQCENCHGAGGNHISDPSANKMTVSLASDTCGKCHTGFHHPNFEQWQTSAHAGALQTLVSSGFASDACLECHSAEAILTKGDHVVLPSPAQVVAKQAITCVVCHNPHGSSNPTQLRKPLADLCIQCHTDEQALPNSAPHHPQGEMFLGKGGFDANGNAVVGPNSPHTSVVSERCVRCHVYQVPNPTPTVENPVNTGHTFIPAVPLACQECHPGNQAVEFKTDVQGEITARLDVLGHYFTVGDPQYIDPNTLSGAALTAYKSAKFNYLFVQGDKSFGVHNTEYAEHLLDIAEAIVGVPPAP